ncbi:MAG: hypothetical protein QXP27_09030, partial [Candidatus Methanomethyliaceae archaeon]
GRDEFRTFNLNFSNEKLITDYMPIAYRATFESNNISVTPGPSLGTVNENNYELMKLMIINGTVDCDLLKKYKYTIVIEKSLKELPECLELTKIHREYRV